MRRGHWVRIDDADAITAWREKFRNRDVYASMCQFGQPRRNGGFVCPFLLDIDCRDDLMKARALSHGDVPSDTVGIGSKITVRRVSDQHETELTILGPWESNVELNVFSYRTPLALELLGKGIGDTATLKLDGSAQEYSIAGLDAII